MPRKAKDKDILNEDNKTKKSINKNTTKAKTKTTKKSTAIKKSSNKKNVTDKKSSTKKIASTKKKASTKKNDFLVEYYDLPYKYNKTIVKVLAQTPETLFVYWEISDDNRNNFIKKYGENFFETTTPILKVHNKTKNYTFEIEINDFANCWYLHINDSKCNYEIELDRKINASNAEYVHISSSNNIESPNDHILFEQNLSKVQFRNVKTNEIKSIDIRKNIHKFYNIENLYKLLYTEEEFKNIKHLSNPSSGNPTSTFK